MQNKLTKEQILALEGRALDEKAALTFGFKIDDNPEDDCVYVQAYLDTVGMEGCWEPFCPSTDRNAAHLLLEEIERRWLQAKFIWCLVELLPNGQPTKFELVTTDPAILTRAAILTVMEAEDGK